MASGIYVISTLNGRVYIGSSNDLERRKREHLSLLKRGKHHCLALQKAFDKFGQSCNFIVIEYCEPEILIEREQSWIDISSKLWIKRIYNGSLLAGRPDFSEETRRKMSESGKKKPPMTEHTKQLLREAMIGQKRGPFTEDHKQKIKEARQLQTFSQETRDKISAKATGRKHSDETRRKIGRGNAGKPKPPRTEDHCRKISLALTGAPRKAYSEQALANIREGVKKRSEAARLRRESNFSEVSA